MTFLFETLIDDVDYHEAVEIHGIADGVWALLVMRQEAEMRTKFVFTSDA